MINHNGSPITIISISPFIGLLFGNLKNLLEMHSLQNLKHRRKQNTVILALRIFYEPHKIKPTNEMTSVGHIAIQTYPIKIFHFILSLDSTVK